MLSYPTISSLKSLFDVLSADTIVPNPCDGTNPCMNDGTCYDQRASGQSSTFICECPLGYGGKTCGTILDIFICSVCFYVHLYSLRHYILHFNRDSGLLIKALK